MAKKRFVFFVSSKWGRPRMTKFEVIKETSKLLKLGNETEIFGGSHYLRQIHKENDPYFDDPIEAIESLISNQAKVIKQCEIKLDDAHDDKELLEELLKEMRKNELD